MIEPTIHSHIDNILPDVDQPIEYIYINMDVRTIHADMDALHKSINSGATTGAMLRSCSHGNRIIIGMGFKNPFTEACMRLAVHRHNVETAPLSEVV